MKDALDDASNEDIRVLWDALMLTGLVIVKLDAEHLKKEKVKKTEGEAAWTRLTKIMEMGKDEWAAQFMVLKVKVHGIQDLRNFHLHLKQTSMMKKMKKSFSERSGVPVTSLRFVYDRKEINDGETPKTLEMEPFDTIEVFRVEPE